MLTILHQNKYDFTWIKPEKEFRYNGKMYDIEDEKLKEIVFIIPVIMIIKKIF